MRAFELTLGFSQSQLSTLATVSTMSRMGCCLIWGLLADTYGLNFVLGGGLFVMGLASIVLSSASHYRSILFLRFLHGFGFACVYPVQQKIVSNTTSSMEEKKEKESKASEIFTTFQALNCIGYVWILFGIGIVFGMESKPSNGNHRANGDSSDASSSGAKTSFKVLLLGTFTEPFTRPSTYILIFTLFIAEAPMCAFNYMTIYLQYLGVSDTMAGVAIAVTLIGGAAGSGAGGEIIKEIAKIQTDNGELSSGVVVMGIRLAVCLLFFLGTAPCGKLLWYHYVELATLGGTLVTVGGVDRAMLKKAIEDQYQATASAVVRTISGISSSVILFQVSAYLTEKVFGYVPSRESFEIMDAAVKERNAEALRKSMMYIILAGTLLNVVCYVALYFTYETDKINIKNDGDEPQSSSAAAPQSR
ncbi:major facilitator superfamily member protein [Babesia ovata]|uniref:Major facilitator superfamily member protein n=1 Tax=Babesia ovata TaxID=189622 RepID=A0A2H6KDJ6_9APIC|nr:major facilitator superfamily member protein [Babesia ovata]GBE61072.1 major facilitator superfamily member protein [Babesia ovata]